MIIHFILKIWFNNFIKNPQLFLVIHQDKNLTIINKS